MPDTQDPEPSVPPAPELTAAAPEPAAEAAPEAPAASVPAEAAQEVPAEEKHEQRLAESALEAAHSNVLPLTPIETAAPETAAKQNGDRKHGHRGLRRGNAGRGNHHDANAAAHSVGIVENPKDAKESLSGKFVDGYEKDKEFRRAREKREAAAASAHEKSAAPAGTAAANVPESPAAPGWCLTEPAPANSAAGATDPLRRRNLQASAGASRGKLYIEPAPIPEQEKDPSLWQRFKAKLLSLFGLNKKKNKDGKKRRRGNKNGNGGNGKSFPPKNGAGKGGEFRKGDRGNDKRGEFRGGNRRGRRGRGRRGGNSGARPQSQNGGGSAPAAS